MNRPKRQFYHLSKAWYKDIPEVRDYIDEVMFGSYYEDDGCEGEMCMRWYNLREDRMPTPRLEVFDDCFKVLNDFKDVIQKLSGYTDKKIQPEEFCKLLIGCGFKDRTPTKRGS